MRNNSVDFAIITALRIERDAVRDRLDSCEVLQEDFEPLTYYYGRVSIPGSNEYYTVVLVALLGMGNNEAAVATTRLLQRWEPVNVMMVGIAGGVRGKLELGDVVVSTFCYYYEMAKLTTEGDQRRSEQFLSDRLLYGRAYAYEASEWKGQISVLRPGTVQTENALPEVHFAPIASGEKVIADAETLPRLLQDCPKLLAVAMEGAGVARAAANHTNPPRFLEIRGISDFADAQKNDNWHGYAANAAAAFTIGLLRSRPIPPLAAVKTARTVETPLLILRAQSLRAIAPDEVIKSFGDDLKRREVETSLLDFTDLVANGVFTSPETAVQRITEPQGALFGTLARRGEAELVFHGIIHIPLAILAGHLITDRQPVRFFDFHPSPGSNTWSWPGDGEEFPPMDVQGLPETLLRHTGDVIIRITVSYKVFPEQTRKVVPEGAIEVDLKLLPQRGIVRSENQVREYGQVFRRTMDLITQRIPNVNRVHIFYAGPVSLAFHIGQQISENIHPPVIVWNFHRGYDWAIDLAAAYVGEQCVIRPTQA
ncbi:SAVED domain-containing protein [Nostoc sp. 'Peltigera membranacea cyanobiont' N6]|uniref:SAVED domain-containing protein n=1 Tax=Nostoc sp. 'Peltigera membranacea cyanobiont' N6 TaxID=1261031 RepID=UPI000CF34310|nr:SAVED domain-containing protein [Nostoc sp. 'Peltigera membranacea cyanobiont' N6]AVH68381.1 nucleoside phosphorylase [Nostoc sp. 'Peltigera membranacea cyanobiont' N6]